MASEMSFENVDDGQTMAAWLIYKLNNEPSAQVS